MRAVVGFLIRLFLVVAGVIFALSFLLAMVVFALFWCVRAVWARLTGKPVAPWSLRFCPGAGWSQVYRSAERWQAQPKATATPDAAATKPKADVTDVEVKEMRH